MDEMDGHISGWVEEQTDEIRGCAGRSDGRGLSEGATQGRASEAGVRWGGEGKRASRTDTKLSILQLGNTPPQICTSPQVASSTATRTRTRPAQGFLFKPPGSPPTRHPQHGGGGGSPAALTVEETPPRRMGSMRVVVVFSSRAAFLSGGPAGPSPAARLPPAPDMALPEGLQGAGGRRSPGGDAPAHCGQGRA